ncbi:MAG: SLC13 family permease [Xanthomonadales bacterium]|jgi:di/tricarboxylate transporter|nr:SLC13 family permease [Xanthomonadales bacterium]
MVSDQFIVFATLIAALIFFIWGRWRYDIVAVSALLLVTVTGIIPADEAFSGFGHPAVITVAAVLLLSRGLQNSGLIDVITGLLVTISARPSLQILTMTCIVAFFSAFMNNVGAIAIMLPVAIQIARKNDISPSLLLMPLSFGSLLGGLTTMIGTPPNIIIAQARTRTGNDPFTLFDFSPVGLGVAVAGIIFISLIGWRLLPKRKGQTSQEALYNVEDYLTEIRIEKDSVIAGWRLHELRKLKDLEVNVVGIVRGKTRIISPALHEVLAAGDILVVEADSEDLKAFVDQGKLELAEDKQLGKDILGSEEMHLTEAIVMADSLLVGRTANSLNLRRRFNLNLLAVARKGARLKTRVASTRFQTGDILLLSGPFETIHETIQHLGCLPLAPRNLRLGYPKRVAMGTVIFASAIAAAALDFLPIQLALVAAAVLMVCVNLISVREIYSSIDWSVIILLGAMIPVGRAMEMSGGAETIARQILAFADVLTPAALLFILLICTMLLSDVINNAATAVLMAPISINIAEALGVSTDPFLMCVALGASCTFLTPIGHQSNTLVLGPGGYRFGDYWRMGLPLEILVLLVALPMILWVWPL